MFQKKHSSHSITADVDIAETAKAAQFFLADGVVLTGTSTGSPASASELRQVMDPCIEICGLSLKTKATDKILSRIPPPYCPSTRG